MTFPIQNSFQASVVALRSVSTDWKRSFPTQKQGMENGIASYQSLARDGLLYLAGWTVP